MNQSLQSPADGVPLLSVDLDLDTRTISPRGELDLATLPLVRAAADRLLQDPVGDVTVDFAGLTFVDAGALGALIGYSNTLNELGARLTLTGTTPRHARLFAVAGLASWAATA